MSQPNPNANSGPSRSPILPILSTDTATCTETAIQDYRRVCNELILELKHLQESFDHMKEYYDDTIKDLEAQVLTLKEERRQLQEENESLSRGYAALGRARELARRHWD